MRRTIFFLQTLLLTLALCTFQACVEERYVTPSYDPYAARPAYISQPYGYGPAYDEGRREARERLEANEEQEEREEREEREEHDRGGRFGHHYYY